MLDIQPVVGYTIGGNCRCFIVVGRSDTECNQENRMQLFKITCPQCPQYDLCSQKTRMFVNYCGSKSSTVLGNIRAAVTECKSKRGYMLQSVIFPPTPRKSGAKTFSVANAMV